MSSVFRFLSILCLFLCGVVCAPGCSDEVALQAPGPGDPCAKEGDRYAQSLVCRAGLWQPQTPGLDMGPQDAGADGALPQDAADGADAQLCLAPEEVCQQRCGQVSLPPECGQGASRFCPCPVGQSCQEGQCQEVAGCETTAQVCARLGAQCGLLTEVVTNCTTLPSVNCGGCQGTGENCNESSGRCECVAEAAQATCQRKSNACGMNTLENNCGQMVQVDCGGCAQGDCLSDGTCSQCQEETVAGFCTRLGRACGPVSGPDACTKRQRSEECGSCGNDRVCSGLGQCDCPAPSCQGLECGPVSNRCGQTADCPSSCGANEFCASNQCQCTPETDQQLCAAVGRACGEFTVADRCGKPREPDCGGCAGGQVCTDSGACCTPRTEAQLCMDNGLKCGSKMVTDNCNNPRTLNCGGVAQSCSPPENTCSGNQCVCVDGRTDAQLCAASGLQCGSKSVTDACGRARTVNCGSVAQSCSPPNNTCSGNQCICTDTRTNDQLCAANGFACGFGQVLNACGDSISVLCPDTCFGNFCCNHVTNSCVKSTSGQVCLQL